MSPSEIGFLALGLALGIAAGAALLAAVRPRTRLGPAVRVTVTPNALWPRDLRGVADPRISRISGPVPGTLDDDARLDYAEGLPVGVAAPPREPVLPPNADRTPVPSRAPAVASSAIGIPIVGDGRPAPGPLASAAPLVAVAERPGAAPSTAVANLPPAARIDVGPSRAGVAVRARPPSPGSQPQLAPVTVAIPVVAGRAPSGEGGASAKAAAGSPATDTCADERTRSAAACASADETREAARALADQLREAQRAHADLQARVEEAAALSDPRRIAAEKERLHAQFKAAHGATATADEAEAAAREWLTAISAANTAARDAARRVQTGTEELRAQAGALERLELEASSARIGAERAEEACRAAREALAACEERQRPAPAPQQEPGPGEPRWPAGQDPAFAREGGARADAQRMPVILLVLRGDTSAREHLVAELAAGDPSAIAAWHVRIAKFVDAVVASAIEDGFIDPSEADPFWRLFSGEEQRQIVLALSALGFRFDGMRGFTDDRVPSARDLSLAVGYAGLDSMRIRNWPNDAALAQLFADASVRADLWLADQADDLALGRVEAALGARAAGLSELWDAWGRVRPAMLEER